jgi:chemotaxis signal transduction protein
MTENPRQLSRRLERLRKEFDQSFSLPIALSNISKQNALLCFRTGGARFALPLSGLQTLAKTGTIVRVPTGAPGLIGITAIRSTLIPLYSVNILTKLGSGQIEAGWVAVLRGEKPAAIAIESLDGQVQDKGASAIAPTTLSRHINGSVQHGTELYATLDCAALYEAITHPQVPAEESSLTT